LSARSRMGRMAKLRRAPAVGALLVVVFGLLSGCRGGSAPTSPARTPAPLPTPAITQSILPTDDIPVGVPASTQAAGATAEPAHPTAPQNTQYHLTAALNYDQHDLAVDEQITYTNHTTDTLDNLVLMVDPLYYPGTFHLKGMTWADGNPVEDLTWQTGQAQVGLPRPLAPGEILGLSISYELSLPSPTPSAETRPVPFGYTARQTNLVDWYPFIPPYVPGKGWLAHPAGYFGEHLVYEDADFQVDVHVGDQRQDLVIAASAPAEAREGGWYHYELDQARNFAWSVSHEYQVITQTVGSVTVWGYAFPYHAWAGESALKTTAEALALYQELFGPYPRQTLSVVEADFLDGMEYDGLFFLSDGFYNTYSGTPGEYLTAIAAHETAHQWWYALVGNDQAMEPWLDEALCTYSERIFYEKLHPEALDWWWAYRVNYYEPKGWVNGSIYNPEGYRAYRDAVYLNGAVFLENLRKLVGDEAFFAFLKDYAAQYAHKIATGEDFFRVLKEHTSTDISGLVGIYFNPNLP
jgi:hypothetical protein